MLCAPLVQSYCSTPFTQCVILLLFLDLLLCSFCLTCCSTPLVQLVVQLLLFDLLFCSSCWTWYLALFTWPIVLLLLFNMFSTPFTWPLTHVPLCYTRDFVIPCSFCSTLLLLLLLFQIGISPPFTFLLVWIL
jgi:hypothetical protein